MILQVLIDTLQRAGDADRRAGSRDRPARQGGSDGTPADDHPRHRPDHRDRDRSRWRRRRDASAAGRDFAAWLGLTPLQQSTGGKQKLGAISKMGERTLRRLLIIGASAVVLQAASARRAAGSWLAQMLARKPRMLVTVALANKMARIVWALLAKRRDLQSSGRGGVSRAAAARRRGRRTVEGGYGATVGETGPGKPGLSTVLRARLG